MSRILSRRSLMDRMDAEIRKVGKEIIEVGRQLKSLEKRKGYMKVLIEPSRKRKRSPDSDFSESEKVKKKRKVVDDRNTGDTTRLGSRSNVLGDKKLKERGKRFMKFLNFQLIHHRKQIKKKSVDDRGGSRESLGSDKILRKKEIAKEEEENIKKEEIELKERKENLKKKEINLKRLHSEYDIQLKNFHKANYLKTSTNPPVYYLPRILTKEMKDTISVQKNNELDLLKELEKEVDKLL